MKVLKVPSEGIRFLCRFRWALALLLTPTGPTVAQPTVLNVEIDYMVDGGDHTHKPNQSEIDAVIQMFACQGITLNVVIDDPLVHHDVLRRDPDDDTNFFEYDDGSDTFLGIKNASFDNGDGWHYAVFGHQYQAQDYSTTSSSGLGEMPGEDFIVTLGNFNGNIGTAWDRAATFAHELGHNLGLGHSGELDPDVVGPYMPNLPSVMSYFYQLIGVRTALRCFGLASEDSDETLFKNLDYSHGHACDLDESALNESFGMGIIPVDWDCNGVIGGTVSQDLAEQKDGWCGSTAGHDVLDDHNEWFHLEDVTTMDPANRPEPQVVSCVTREEIDAFRAQLTTFSKVETEHCTQATLTVEACVNERMTYLRGGNNFAELGVCWLPYQTADTAYALAGDGDIWYVGPGSYPDSNLVLDKQLLILGPGGGVIGDK